jgi:hypothetical protein
MHSGNGTETVSSAVPINIEWNHIGATHGSKTGQLAGNVSLTRSILQFSLFRNIGFCNVTAGKR